MNDCKVCTNAELHARKHWLYTFAGQAMQGLLVNHADKYDPEGLAMDAVNIAILLLAELEKEPTP